MNLEEAWYRIENPVNRYDYDLLALRIIARDQEARLKSLEAKKVGRPRKEESHA